MKKFIIKREDGGISIGIHIEGDNLDDEIRKWEQTSPSKSSYHQYEDRFPNDEDGYFHEAYDHHPDKGVFIDLEKARPLHMDKLRKMRHKKFIEMGFPHKLNSQIENSILDDDTKIKLQELRDLPQKYDLSIATTSEQLRNMIPDILK